MADIVISKDLIALNIDSDNKEEAIKILADKLREKDLVKDGYCENVLRREENFPTGLPTIIPIALCHTEAEFVNASALTVGTLVNPIAFKEMGSPDKDVMAEIIFLLALNDPKDQVPWLMKMITVFKSKETLEQIKNSTDEEELEILLTSIF